MATVKTDATEGIKTVMTEPTQNEGEKTSTPSGVLLQAKELSIRTRAGVSLITDISFHIEPGELVALTDMGRSGKSTLLKSLAGLMEPESGEVLIDGINLYANLKAFRSLIGYIPDEFSVQQNYTVLEILQEAALLRLPRRISSQDRRQRVQAILNLVGLTSVTARRVELLNNVEKRRLSIAVELLGYPKLLLLDESIEPLIAFDELQITILLRELSRQGLTIIQVNPRSRSAGVSDKIIFLAPGGYLAFFGPPDEALSFLKGLVPRGVVKDMFGLQQALEMLVNPQERDGAEWAKRFQDHEAYQKYVDDPMHNRYPDLLLQTHPLIRLRLRNSSKEKLPPPIVPRASSVQKFLLLLQRNFRSLWRDKSGLLMVAIPPFVALVYFLLTSTREDPNPTSIEYDLFIFLVVLTAAMLVQNEIFKERTVYSREQRTSSLLFPYVFSKVWLVGLLAVYQGFVWTIVQSFGRIASAAGSQNLLSSLITLSLVAFFGGVLGLMVSALSKRTLTSISWVLLLTAPLLLLIFNPLNSWLSLVIVSLFLIILLLVIQNRAGSVRTS
jgi:ABC-type multidrug transport system ATPase subunit